MSQQVSTNIQKQRQKPMTSPYQFIQWLDIVDGGPEASNPNAIKQALDSIII